MLAFGCPLYELREGATYEASLGDLGAIRGIRVAQHKKGYYLLSMKNWSQSVLGFFAEQAGEDRSFTLQSYRFGDAAGRASDLKNAFDRIGI